MSQVWTDEETRPFRSPWWDAWVLDVTDGDTFHLLVDGPFDVMSKVKVRLIGETGMEDKRFGVDAWETRGAERELGIVATKRVKEILNPPALGQLVGNRVRIWSRKGGSRGSFNRWLCAVFYRDAVGWRSVGDVLVEEGHAEEWWRGRSQGRPRPE